MTYKVTWRSLIPPPWSQGSRIHESEFDTQNEAENFILSLKMAKNREFVRADFKFK